MLDEVLYGLSRDQKFLHSKYFYDERGSRLFDEITDLEEYYPTRTEFRILRDNVNEIADQLGQEVVLIEPGSGSSGKTQVLLDNLDEIKTYIPIDISGDYIFKVAARLQKKYPEIHIEPLQADYTHSIELPDQISSGNRVVFFPGSTIGNFKRDTVDRFLKVVADILEGSGGFLIGVDLKKDREVLLNAYNDKKGVTAEFNKNILRHLNRELEASFDLQKFNHKAIWNEGEGRIEMHLISQEDHSVNIAGTSVSFSEGESIHTENSHKYTLTEFEEIVSPCFDVKCVWTDEKNWFSLQYLQPK